MNKYIDAEKLKAKINGQLAFYLGTAYSVKDTNAVDGLNDALEIIESLQQEQPEVDCHHLLSLLIDAIDYSFLKTDGTYDMDLSYPVIDKVCYIKKQLKSNEEDNVQR